MASMLNDEVRSPTASLSELDQEGSELVLF